MVDKGEPQGQPIGQYNNYSLNKCAMKGQQIINV